MDDAVAPPPPHPDIGEGYPVHQAIRRGNVELAKELIINNPQLLDAPDDMHSSPLLIASRWGRIELCQWLLDQGADIHQVDDHGYSAIMWACDRGRLELLILLLEQGANPNGRDILDYNCLMMASHYGWSHIINHLLSSHHHHHHHHHHHQLDVNATTEEGNYTALYIAAKNGHEEVVKALLQAKADPSIQDDQGRDALQRAKTFRHHHVVKILEEALMERERSYLLYKARLLHDTTTTIALTHEEDRGGTGDGGGHPQAAADAANAGEEATKLSLPLYLEGRMESGADLPQVEIEKMMAGTTLDDDGNGDDEEGEGRRTSSKTGIGLLHEVLEYVIKGDLVDELFIDLMGYVAFPPQSR